MACPRIWNALCGTGSEAGDGWSLTVEDSAGRVERLLTLEVRSWRREIVQARGRVNRMPYPEEMGLLALWARAGGPRLAP
jgi:hypothetical protein